MGASDGYGSTTATPACIDSDGVPALLVAKKFI